MVPSYNPAQSDPNSKSNSSLFNLAQCSAFPAFLFRVPAATIQGNQARARPTYKRSGWQNEPASRFECATICALSFESGEVRRLRRRCTCGREPRPCTTFRFRWLGSRTGGWKCTQPQPSRNCAPRSRSCRCVQVDVDGVMQMRQ